MKSLKIISISISLIAIISALSTQSHLKQNPQQPQAPTAQPMIPAAGHNITEVFNKLFTDPTRSEFKCPCKKTPEQLNAEKVNITEDGAVWATPQKKENFYEKKRIGWDASSYFFDYIDPVLQKSIVTEFDRIFKEAQRMAAPANFKDPYTLERLLGINAAGQIPSKDELVKRITSLNPKFNAAQWETSISVAQMEAILKQWSWYYDASRQFPGKYIVDKFDFDGDGRLNAREFIIAVIMNNKNVVTGPQKCKNCLESVIESLITPIYMYLDCGNTNTVSAEQLWIGLQKLKKDVKGYDVFKCALENGKYRTSAMNDFILKSHKEIEGKLTLQEFRLGILTGYWDRHIEGNKIFLDDTKNMKKLRWANNGEIDIVCERIKNNIQKNKGI
jgi:hypothetical protein